MELNTIVTLTMLQLLVGADIINKVPFILWTFTAFINLFKTQHN